MISPGSRRLINPGSDFCQFGDLEVCKFKIRTMSRNKAYDVRPIHLPAYRF